MITDEKPDTRSDEGLVSDYLKGDEQAFSILLDRYQKPLIAYIYPSVRNYHTAEDIAFETLEYVWQAIRRFDSQKSSFKKWLYLIADSRKIDKLRRIQREPPTTALIPEEIPLTGDIVIDMQEIEPSSQNRVLGLVEAQDEMEIQEIKEKCLSVLSDDDRLLYQLKLEQGLTYKEILNYEPFKESNEDALMQRFLRLKKTMVKELSKYL